MNPQDEDRDTTHTSAYDPFPQPQTIPSGWDLSSLLAALQPVPVVDEADASETKPINHEER